MQTKEYRILLDNAIADISYTRKRFESMLNIFVQSFGRDRVTTEIIDL